MISRQNAATLECDGNRVDHSDGSWECTRIDCIDPADAHWFTTHCAEITTHCWCR